MAPLGVAAASSCYVLRADKLQSFLDGVLCCVGSRWRACKQAQRRGARTTRDTAAGYDRRKIYATVL